ncbi:hypothetical protein HY634_03415 [Candidatus Uhrbacteria bacterium]|nr:hypothetical protein [Candidatus Uhrbacteria bacterium]
MSIRKRAIAIGWVLGRTYPFTGIGAGQMRGGAKFDAAAEQVRREAHISSLFPWKRIFFKDTDVPVAAPDKGVFNIFMNAWAETGAPGLIAIVGLLIVVCWRGVVALWKTRYSTEILPIVVLLPLFLALLLYHQTIYLWVHPWFWSALALTYAAARAASDEGDAPSSAGT